MEKHDWKICRTESDTVIIDGSEYKKYISGTCLDCELRYTPVCKMNKSDCKKLECADFHIWKQEGVRNPLSEVYWRTVSDYALVFCHMYLSEDGLTVEGNWVDEDYEKYNVGGIHINFKDMRYAVDNQVERDNFFKWLKGYKTVHDMSLRQWRMFNKE